MTDETGTVDGDDDEERRASAYEREAQIFPRLTRDQLERISRFGKRERLTKGTATFTRGDRSVDCFVILSGSIEIIDHALEGDRVITTHGPRNFTGELDLFNDREILVSGRMGEDGEIVRLDRLTLRRLLTAEPDIGEVVTRALILRRMGLIEETQGGVTVLGDRDDGETLRIERFLRRNGYPVRLIHADTNPTALGIVRQLAGNDLALPALLKPGSLPIGRPSNFEIAEALGLIEQPIGPSACDVVVVGGGPSGLAAAVYAASEGLATLVIEEDAPGGQASTSSKIENYLGFPTGISGQALAGRAQVQAQKFGAVIAVARRVVSLDCSVRPYILTTADGTSFRARSVVIASGAAYRRLDLPNLESFEGAGVHYAATAIEAEYCEGREIAIVGGGNSAGQAAVFLSRHARHVHLLIRKDTLSSTMSDYLVSRIEASPDITLHRRTEVVALDGQRALDTVRWRNIETGEEEERKIANLFLMIGAVPNAGWLNGCVALDGNGFVLTGMDASDTWPLERRPFFLETSQPGVFAVGDVRSGSIKRVASAVGEGSVAVQSVHHVLAELALEEEDGPIVDLPLVGRPGSVAEHQVRRLEEWGLADIAAKCVTREQAMLVHHCALYVRMVWLNSGRDGDPPIEAIRHCVGELVQDADLIERASQAVSASFAAEDRDPDFGNDKDLHLKVSEGLAPFLETEQS
ncbi:MAG: FAD-dependent oxidoreductase [Pseudomonadota bacterium]